MLSVQIYDSGGNTIIIDSAQYEDDSIWRGLNENQSIVRGARLTFSATKTNSPSPNMGMVSLYGLDREIRDIVDTISEITYGDKDKTKGTFVWESTDDTDNYVYTMEYPSLARVEYNTKKGRIEEIKYNKQWVYREIAWGKIAIYNDNEIIYVGDIIDVTHNMETTNIECGTGYFHLTKFPFSQRIVKSTPDEPVVSWSIIGDPELDLVDNDNDTMEDNVENKIKLAYEILSDLERVDIHRDTKVFIPDYNDDTWVKTNAEYQRILANMEQVLWIYNTTLTKARKTPKNSKNEDLKTNTYFILGGDNIQGVLETLSNSGLFTVFCLDDIWHIKPYWETENEEPLIFQIYHGEIDWHSDNHLPCSGFSIDKNDRAVFSTTLLENLLYPSYGVKIEERPGDDTYIYIDTIELTGDSDTGIVATYSGRINKFQFKGGLIP